jgi:hypothetical protein
MSLAFNVNILLHIAKLVVLLFYKISTVFYSNLQYENYSEN